MVRNGHSVMSISKMATEQYYIWYEMVMVQNTYGTKWLWYEMTSFGLFDFNTVFGCISFSS
jgi:hypothetical protein